MEHFNVVLRVCFEPRKSDLISLCFAFFSTSLLSIIDIKSSTVLVVVVVLFLAVYI